MHRYVRKGAVGLAAALGLLGTIAIAHAQDAEKNAQKFFMMTDRDGNHVISRSEYQERMVEVFYLADANKDGYVTIEELREIGPVDPGKFASADVDDDGKLTIQEFIAIRMVDFDQADTNHDGVLSEEEVIIWSKAHTAKQ